MSEEETKFKMWVINVEKNTNTKDATTYPSLSVGQASRLSAKMKRFIGRTLQKDRFLKK